MPKPHTLESTCELLRRRLSPEFTVRVLGATVRGGDFLNIQVAPKIVIELPKEHGGLRLTLHNRLRRKAGLDNNADSRALDGACINIDGPQKLKSIAAAVRAGKLDGVTILSLRRGTPHTKRARVLLARQHAGGFSEGLMQVVSAGQGVDYKPR